MRSRALVVAAGLGVALATTSIAFAVDEDLPDFLSADDQRPVAEPQEGQQVLVAQVLLASDGKRVSAEVQSLEVIDSFAPKVVARSGGEWEVRLLGGRELAYKVPDPLDDIEAERLDDEKQPYESVPLDNYDWTLIAPLYQDAEPLRVTSVRVVDLETGQVILETEIPTKNE